MEGGLKRFQIKGMLSCVCVYVVCRAITGRLTYRMNFLMSPFAARWLEILEVRGWSE